MSRVKGLQMLNLGRAPSSALSAWWFNPLKSCDRPCFSNPLQSSRSKERLFVPTRNFIYVVC
jgi:hypothetical protein